MQQVRFSPLSDITTRMSGTIAPWPFPVTAAYVNGVSTAFTWVTGTLTIASYTSGVVLIEYGLYLLYDAPSQFLPSDPTNALSALAYWENRLANFVSFSNSMKAFETGLTEINVGAISVRLDDNWLVLSQYQLILPNSTIRIYNNGVIGFKGVASKHTVSNYNISINIQKRLPILDAECHFGDPPHLCRIDRTSNTSFYNGANVPSKFDNFAIPMLFGPQFPFEQNNYAEIDIGPVNTAYPGLPQGTKFSQYSVNTDSVMVQVIPISSSVGILGRMPSFQTLVSAPADVQFFNAPPFPINQRVYRLNQDALFSFSPATPILDNTISGEILLLKDNLGGGELCGSRVWRKTPTSISMFLGDDVNIFDNYSDVISYSTTEHWFCGRIPDGIFWTLPAVASGTPTPGSNRWITANFTGVDLLTTEVYVVLNGITGAKNHFDLMQWILEQHGLTVEPTSFAALNSAFPVTTVQQAGIGDFVPTLGQLIAEMNRDLMTILVFPKSNDVPFIKKIDAAEAPLLTLTDRHIAGIQISNEYRNQAATVKWFPKYARSDTQVTSLFRSIDPQNAAIFNSQKTLAVDHVLSQVTAAVKTRWDEVTEIYGSPETVVSFELLDDSITIDIGDTIMIDHDLFRNKILIITIEQRPTGRLVTGRYFYVNAG